MTTYLIMLAGWLLLAAMLSTNTRRPRLRHFAGAILVAAAWFAVCLVNPGGPMMYSGDEDFGDDITSGLVPDDAVYEGELDQNDFERDLEDQQDERGTSHGR